MIQGWSIQQKPGLFLKLGQILCWFFIVWASLSRGLDAAETAANEGLGKGSILPTNAVASISAPSEGATTNAVRNPMDDSIRLGIGDRLSFKIIEDQEDAKPLYVLDSGELDVPYLGRVSAQGKTCRELAGEIKRELEKEYYYQATVVLSLEQYSRSRRKIYIDGYVRAPGPQDIPSDEVFTLSKAILRAGGFTEFADKKKVRVVRKGSTNSVAIPPQFIDVGAILDGGKTEQDVRLDDGDYVIVPSRLFRF